MKLINYSEPTTLMTHSNDDLLKRISGLVKQNQELIDENERLKNFIGKLENELERLKIQDAVNKEPEKGLKKVSSKVKKFEMATVIFASIHGFRNILDSNNSAGLMDELDSIIVRFDGILEKYNIHKIKTIGDSYMAAGGIPVKNITNPVQVVMAALEMKEYLDEYQKHSGRNEKIWELKIGIHTGPVTALINGKKKASYEIKGDTVNMVSRIGSLAPEGSILISVMSYELVKEFFNCEYFGRMPVKYKGDLELFTVSGLKEEFRVNGSPVKTNEHFHIKYKLIQFTDLQEYILDKLEKELPAGLYYHNVKHTVDVVTEVELIGWAEGVNDEDILLLKTAALLHDAGHTISYDEHEFHGTELAKKILPSYGYSKDEIEKVCRIIMATKLPPQPASLLEEIICDADLDYLGRSDMIPVSNTLYRELKEQNKIGSINEWNELQVKFISGHQYFTRTARKLREVNKQKQIERIRSLITPDE